MLHIKKVRELMIPLKDYPHLPYWFSLQQAVAIVRESAIKFAGSFEPRTVLVFNEKYQIVGILTLRDILKGLEPAFLIETDLTKIDPSLAVVRGELFGPNMKHQATRPVSDVMGPIKVTVNADDSLAKALLLMVKEGVGMMPVLDNQHVVGMVRLTDLFLKLSEFLLADETAE